MDLATATVKPIPKILIGIFWISITGIYIADKLINHINIRLFDWVCWTALLASGIISIAEGIRIRRNISMKR